MRVRCLVTLTMALATLTPAVAEERGSSYSLEQLRVIARSVHPTLDAAEAAVEASSGILRQSQAYPNPEIAFWWVYSIDTYGDFLYASDRDLRRIAKIRMDYRETKESAIP